MGIFVCFSKHVPYCWIFFKSAFTALLLWRQDYEAMLISFLYWLNTNTLVQCCILQSLFSNLCCFYSTRRKKKKNWHPEQSLKFMLQQQDTRTCESANCFCLSSVKWFITRYGSHIKGSQWSSNFQRSSHIIGRLKVPLLSLMKSIYFYLKNQSSQPPLRLMLDPNTDEVHTPFSSQAIRQVPHSLTRVEYYQKASFTSALEEA